MTEAGEEFVQDCPGEGQVWEEVGDGVACALPQQLGQRPDRRPDFRIRHVNLGEKSSHGLPQGQQLPGHTMSPNQREAERPGQAGGQVLHP